jgi:uncharacterized DUF497 family protein
MRYFDWNPDKNEWLKEQRGITFEEIVFHILHGGLLDVLEHPNRKQYPDQKIFVVNVEGYVCLVPFVETEEKVFLKTIIPSRKLTKKYLGGIKDEAK